MTLIIKYREEPSIDEVANALSTSLKEIGVDFNQETSLKHTPQDLSWVLFGLMNYGNSDYNIWYNPTKFQIRDLSDYDVRQPHAKMGYLLYDAKICFLEPEKELPKQGKLPESGFHFEPDEERFTFLKNVAERLKANIPKLETVILCVRGNRDRFDFIKV